MRNWKIGLSGLVLVAVLMLLPERASAGGVRIGVGGGVTVSTRCGDFRVGYRHCPPRHEDYRCRTPQVNRRIYERRYQPRCQGSGYVSWVLGGGLSLSYARYNRPSSYCRDYGYVYPYWYPSAGEQPPVGGQPPVVVVVPEDRRDDDAARLAERSQRWRLERGQDEEEYLAILLDQLRSRDGEERLEAVRALAKFPPDSRLRKALEKALKEDPEAKIRREAARALGEMGEEAAISALEKVQEKDPDRGVREEAKRAIEGIRFARPLVQLESGDKDDRKEAVKKLAKLPYPSRVIEVLGGVLLSDPEPEVREEAAEQLGGLKEMRALPILRKASSDPDEDVRKAVEKAQKKISQSVPPRPSAPLTRRAPSQK